MDFPFFHLEGIGNRMLMAVIATIHVFINHALAVGLIPLVAALEYLGYRKRKADATDAEAYDRLAYKILRVGFIITTSLGALTGVGIWFSASLLNPAAIGSLIRVFYGAWFSEWIVFVLEVVSIMVFYLTWKRSTESLSAKKNHLRLGLALSIFSFLTMVIIVAILGFMMDPGNWLSKSTFLNGMANPLYIPQLYFRTPVAMMMGGAAALLMALFFLKKNNPIRPSATSFISLWILIWTPVCAAGALAYRAAIPGSMVGNLPTAVTTHRFTDWYGTVIWVILAVFISSLLVSLWGFLKPRRLPRAALIIPMAALILLVGMFERVREFVRKPYVIGNYMYANGLRVRDYPLYQEQGIYPFIAYRKHPALTRDNRSEVGQELFMAACSRCHTMAGINSVVDKFRDLSPEGTFISAPDMSRFMGTMHKIRTYMPPFPGTAAELEALAEFIFGFQEKPVEIKGAQHSGAAVPPGAPFFKLEEESDVL